MVTSRWELFRGSCSSPNCLTTKTDAAIPVFPSVPRGHLLQGPALRASTRYSTPHHGWYFLPLYFLPTSWLVLPSVVLLAYFFPLYLQSRCSLTPLAARLSSKSISVAVCFLCNSLKSIPQQSTPLLSHRSQSPLQFVSSQVRSMQLLDRGAVMETPWRRPTLRYHEGTVG